MVHCRLTLDWIPNDAIYYHIVFCFSNLHSHPLFSAQDPNCSAEELYSNQMTLHINKKKLKLWKTMSETWFNNYLFSFAGSGGRICGYGRDFCRCWWSEWFVASSEWATISQATTKSKVNINLCTWHLKGEDKRVIGLCVCVTMCTYVHEG